MDLTEAYRALDPLAPLEPDSKLYVRRPDNPMDRVCVDLKLSARPRHYLLAGHRGTGKTTELLRLSRSLQGQMDVVYVDVGESSTYIARDPGRVLDKAIAGKLGLKASDDISGLGELLQSSAGRTSSVVVILDGLERLSGDEDIMQALNYPIPVHTWPVSVICTIPLSLYLSSNFGEHARRFDRSVFLPGITILDREGVPNQQGMETLSSIIRRRTGEQTFTPEAGADLTLQSAGLHRELLQLAQRSCVVAALDDATQVTREHALAAIAEQRNEYSIVLRTADFPILQALMSSKDLVGGSDTSRLIRNQLIVAYANGTTWFDVHPILRPLIEGRGPRWE